MSLCFHKFSVVSVAVIVIIIFVIIIIVIFLTRQADWFDTTLLRKFPEKYSVKLCEAKVFLILKSNSLVGKNSVCRTPHFVTQVL